MYNMHDEGDPKTYDEAISSRDANFWKEAINDEKHSRLTNGTWIYCDLPPGAKAIGCKWISKRKLNVDGTIDKFKAKLVAKGYKQQHCIDYFDTYAPAARITSIRCLIALASMHKLVRYPDALEGYSDANWNNVESKSKSTSGRIFTLADGLEAIPAATDNDDEELKKR
ncbi:uncharacterized protein LOC113279944 [Papaver somniferum]|uniref:uncharacterized protein LOC113279943 n=1 Tax=Papaver somniferum TaxID=3469 RepID=UPI000E6FA09D|nr:uncharacterized protein LOC113279943 [Papaver somniferum]XP_026384365.1 uncharacterized protein LOC113279944 [Papaver somniferum]